MDRKKCMCGGKIMKVGPFPKWAAEDGKELARVWPAHILRKFLTPTHLTIVNHMATIIMNFNIIGYEMKKGDKGLIFNAKRLKVGRSYMYYRR